MLVIVARRVKTDFDNLYVFCDTVARDNASEFSVIDVVFTEVFGLLDGAGFVRVAATTEVFGTE